jgi:5-methylcytosine-specific restriction endonuclease McrA
VSWAGSTRRQRLPANWATPGGLRDQVFAAPDGRVCKLRYEGCTRYATEVDHRRRGDDHSFSNLQAACEHCHKIKSGREGAAARPRQTRRVEEHPARKSMK